MVKRFGVLLLALVVLVSFVGSASAAKVIKIANYFPAENFANKVLYETFKPMVEKETNGELEIQVYPNSQLGAEQEFVEGVQLGTIEMAMTGNLWENTVDIFKLLQLPYLVNSYEHADEVFNGPIGQKVYKHLDPLGVKILGAFPRGFRVISNNKKPINSMDDCKGVKMRVWQGEVIIKLMQGFGFSTVVMPMSEVFTALQQGVVEGQDNPLETSYYSGWYDVQKYVAITNHIFGFQYFVVNQKFWDGLTDSQKAAINKAVSVSIKEITEATKKGDAELVRLTEEKGLKVTYPDLAPFRQAAVPIIEEFLKKTPDAEPIYREIVEAGKKYEKK